MEERPANGADGVCVRAMGRKNGQPPAPMGFLLARRERTTTAAVLASRGIKARSGEGEKTASCAGEKDRRCAKHRCQVAFQLASLPSWGGYLPSCQKCQVHLPNCWRALFLVLPNFCGCQVHLPNSDNRPVL